MKRQLSIRIILVVGLVLFIAYFFSISFYLALIIVASLSLFSESIHMPENLSESMENANRNELHPAKVILIGSLAICVLVGVGVIFPELYNYSFGEK